MQEKKHVLNHKLRLARELRGWTQKDVAQNIDLPDPRTVRRWESGAAIPSLRYRSKLCKLFDMSPDELGLIRTNMSSSFPDEQTSSQMNSLESEDLPSAVQPAAAAERSIAVSQQWSRKRFLEKMQTFWIKGVLEHSFYHRTHVTLHLQSLADVLANPWNNIIPPLPKSPYYLKDSTSILQTYDDACGELLILGKAGAGKTTILLELEQELLQRAFKNESHPIPVIFDLSTWSMKQPRLKNWLIEQMSTKYYIPSHIGKAWVESEQILPLLDGFDEVKLTERQSCLTAINTYRLEDGLVPIVVCSRSEEYLTVKTKLYLQQAVCIEPLTPQQIDTCLTEIGANTEGLRSMLQLDTRLRHAITTPLMLNIVVQLYQHDSSFASADQGEESTAIQREQVFAQYVEIMLRQRQSQSYSMQQNVYWLTQLARQMKRRYRTDFYFEHIHFDWLPSIHLQQLFYSLFIGLQAGLISGGLIGLTALSQGDSFVASLLITPCIAVLIGVMTCLISIMSTDYLTISARKIVLGVIVGLCIGGCTIVIGNMFSFFDSMRTGAEISLTIIIAFLLLRREVQSNKKPASLQTQQHRRFPHFFTFNTAAILGIDVVGGYFGWFIVRLGDKIVVIELFSIISLLMIRYFPVVLEKMLHKKRLKEIKNSILRTGYSATLYGLCTGLLNWSFLIVLSVTVLSHVPDSGLSASSFFCCALAFGLTTGLIVAMNKGGTVCMKYILLRTVLWAGGYLPWNYPQFLDNAVKQALLCRVGDGYKFTDQLLFEHFAASANGFNAVHKPGA